MADTPNSLQWDPMLPGRRTPASATSATTAAPIPSDRSSSGDSADKRTLEPYHWPSPPYACYPADLPQTDPVPCEIVGLNDGRMKGRLTFFVPEESVAHVQIPPARTTLPLRFDQFRAITLTQPVSPQHATANDPHSQMLAQRPVSDYRVTLTHGAEMTGQTIGHVRNEFGLFLFPPVDEHGAVHRTFIPGQAFKAVDVGPRLGEVLIEQHAATSAQVEDAVGTQTHMRRQKLGDILLTRQVVSTEQLVAALERQAKMPMVRIGEALTSLNLVTQEQLEAALTQQQTDRNVPIGELLVRMKLVSREDLQVALARKMGYPLVNVDEFPVEAEAMRKLPYAVAVRLGTMPLLIREGRLVIAMDDPVRRRLDVEKVEFAAQMRVVPVLAQSKSLDAALQAAYQTLGATPGERSPIDDNALSFDMNDTGKLVESMERETSEQTTQEDDSQIEQSDNSLVRLINNLVIEAHRQGVSDIHIESYPGREKTRIRFRKDGLLRTHLELPSNYRNALVSRIKIMCDLDISERRKPQDGKINFAKFSPQHKIELRVATIPTTSGLEDVVMRILASAKPIPLDRLGMSHHNITQLKVAIERPYGLVLCVGPTGSGKTTTLHSALSHINVPERKVWTAEDPVEITQPGLRQVQVNPKIDWTFAKALRAFLRADPDVIMVGEIRDGETSHMAVEASLTGHLVLSTLHTNSAPETVTRLLDMGLDPFNFADALLAVLAQRLVRKLCPHCRTSRPATPDECNEVVADYLHAFPPGATLPDGAALLTEWTARHGRDGRLQVHHSPGCEACDQSGFKGRVGVHELMVVSRELRHMIQTGSRAAELQAVAMTEGMRTLRQDGIEKVLAGLTSIEEVRATSNA